MNKNIFVITNGNITQQENKINSIDWINFRNKIRFIYANSFSKKPSPDSFNYIMVKYSLDRTKCLMIGDLDIDKDFAINSQIDFVFIDKFNLN